MITKVFCSPNGFYWLDVVEPTLEELNEVAKEHQLHSTSVQDCLDPEHSPKFEKIEGLQFLIVRAFDQAASADADTIQELTRKIAIFSCPRFVITVHRMDQPFIAALREKWANKPLPEESVLLSSFLCQFLSATVNSYEKPIDQETSVLESLEARIFKHYEDASVLETGYYLKRKASVFKRVLRLSLDIVPKISHDSPQTGPFLQDVKETLDSLYFYADELVDNINNLLALHVSLSGQRTNEASHRTNEVVRVLTVFSVFFLPLNFVASIYGMNFQHMPELSWIYGYPTVLLLMFSIATGIYLWFRTRRWL